jgi:predicted cupin superfamily sugar epimerase
VSDETIQRIIAKLNLQPMPVEGGLVAQTYRSAQAISLDSLPDGYSGSRAFSTAIYYALTADPDSFSALHCLATDEIYHFYLGDPVELLLLLPGGASRHVILGQDLLGEQYVQLLVPAGTWQGLRLAPGGRFALMGTTMAPGFTQDDFTLGERATLLAGWPQESDLITCFTRI